MNTLHKGHVAELKVAQRALEKGYTVSKPLIEARYDLIVDTGAKLVRVQIKYADGTSSNSSGAVVVGLRHWAAGIKAGKGRTYKQEEVDLLLVYVPKIDKIVYFYPDEFCDKACLMLRLEPTKNGQTKKLCFVKDRLW